MANWCYNSLRLSSTDGKPISDYMAEWKRNHKLVSDFSLSWFVPPPNPNCNQDWLRDNWGTGRDVDITSVIEISDIEIEIVIYWKN